MKRACLLIVSLLVIRHCWSQESSPWTGSAPIMDTVPSSPAELSLRVTDPSLKSFARNDEVVDGGMQSFVLGEKIPVGPADHTPWARPLAGGPVRLTVISELGGNHDIAEIIRRLDCDITQVAVPPFGWFQEMHPEAYSGYFTTRALEALKKPADVLLITGAVRVLPPNVAQAVADKVEAGCGLVLTAGRVYGGGVTVKTAQDSAAAGFNSMHVWFHNPRKWPDPAEPADVKAVLDECERLGLKVIPANTLMPKTCKTFAEWKDKSLETGLFMQFRDHPALLAWDVIDEPGPGWEHEPDWKESNMKELHDACKAADPWRPAFINYYAWKPGYGFYGGLEANDIYSMDCYVLGGWYGERREPYRPFNKAMQIQVKLYEAIRADARRDGKPAHFWLHFYGGGDSYREPSVKENACQTWLALVHGFRMLSYFVYRPMSLDLWQSIEPLREEVTSLAPVFGTPELRGVVRSRNAALHCAAFRYAGSWYLVTVNGTDQAVQASLELSGPPGGSAEVLFEHRSVKTNGKSLADRWQPMERHVYRLRIGGK